MDQDSHRTANVLVGNDADAATIEIAWCGSSFTLVEPALIAITGADLQPTVANQRVPLNRPIWILGNQIIQFHHAKSGCYAYLAVAGGIDTPKSLGSRATHVRSGIGGLNGRPLQARDVLLIGRPSSLSQSLVASIKPQPTRSAADEGVLNQSIGPNEKWRAATWFADPSSKPRASRGIEIQALRGRHFDWLDPSSQRRFWDSEFSIAQASDRMGYRLDGPELHFARNSELLSAGVARGTIQLPPGGNPIALMADTATTGGYPNIAHVASVDFARLAQSQPGQSVRFVEIDLAQAQCLIANRYQCLRQLSCAISLRADAVASSALKKSTLTRSASEDATKSTLAHASG